MFALFTPPQCPSSLALAYNELFKEGLHCLILRLKGATRKDYEKVILSIDPIYRHRILIDDYFDLLDNCEVGGVYLNPSKWYHYKEIATKTSRIATSAHSLEELFTIPFKPTFAMLSPIYDSISKKGYLANISLEECKKRLPLLAFPVLALGGITPNRAKEVLQYGFSGVAVLGYLYESKVGLLSAFLQFSPVEVLSLAGHDPSSGAGLTADTLTIALHDAYPLTIPTLLTAQNEYAFRKTFPLNISTIALTLETLAEKHPLRYAKIGLVSSLDEVLFLAQKLKELGVKYLIWDPILKPTKGEKELWDKDSSLLKRLLSYVDLITPNEAEAILLFGTSSSQKLTKLSQELKCSILLTGIKKHKGLIEDLLFKENGVTLSFSESSSSFEKHGTGCALSSIIIARLAQGYSLEESCKEGQRYVSALLKSSQTLLPDYRQIKRLPTQEKIKKAPLQYITNSLSEEEILAKAKLFLEAGGKWIQLRMKKANHEYRTQVARKLKALQKDYPASILIIDDDVEAVLESGSDGVHLGLNDCSIVTARKRLGRERIIGGTCNTIEDLRKRALEGADYVGIGPYKMTITKENLSPLLGKDGLQRIIEFNNKELPFPIPIIAIGGIEEEDFPSLSKIGVNGVAISSAIDHSNDIFTTTTSLLQKAEMLWQSM